MEGGREELSKRGARGGGEQTHLNRSCSHLLVYNVRTDAFNDNMCTDLKALACEKVLCNAVHPRGENKVSPFETAGTPAPYVLLSTLLEKSPPPLRESWLPNSCYFRPKALLLLSTPAAEAPP